MIGRCLRLLGMVCVLGLVALGLSIVIFCVFDICLLGPLCMP